ncbi:potassium transporter [Thozetella sp. PMI_491]|nr:potassium transporter [Thozetella sp. PMI_491]
MTQDIEDASSTSHGLPDDPARLVGERYLADKHPEAHSESLDDAEKAQKLAQEDLGRARKQEFRGLNLVWLAFQSCGVIYGDIGTSPLYVYSSTFSSQPSWDDLVGALSIIIWSLTLIVTVKYVCIVLLADDDGQGGTFALYSLLNRYANISRGNPNTPSTVKMQRYPTGDLGPVQLGLRRFLEKSPLSQFILQLVGVLGVSMVMADGVLTPAQSVLGAIQGITVVQPELGTPAIIGISCGILIFLFLLQPFGTAKLGTTFAPIVVVWLLFNLASGLYNLVHYDYTVLKAFSPYFAFTYLTRNGHEGWKSLGGLLLAFTGVEALFADLGAFGKKAIQISWLCLAFPCLIIAYAGQAAYISMDSTETAFTNPFYYTVPDGTFYFRLCCQAYSSCSIVIAVLAAIVASQAMITSTFQLLVQVMRLSYFPHIKVIHTSMRFHEQVYIPMANWLLMIGAVVVTAVYNNTTSLGNAYGVCVIFVTFLTTCMVALVGLLIWRIPIYAVLPVFLLFGALDGVYLTSVLTKVPSGAWFTIMLAVILSSIFVLWRFGKEAQWAAESEERLTASDLLVANDSASSSISNTTPLMASFGSTPLSVVPGFGIFFDKSGDSAILPPSFTQFVRKFAVRPQVVIFFHMRPLSMPKIPRGEQYVVTRSLGNRAGVLSNCYNVVMRHGYNDNPLRPGLAQELAAEVELAVSRGTGIMTPGMNISHEEAGKIVASELAVLRDACQGQPVYILGKEAMLVDRKTGRSPWLFCRRLLLGLFLWIRENSRTKLADMDIDVDRLVEVGFLKQI